MTYSQKLAFLVKNSGLSLRQISEKCKSEGYQVDPSYISKLQSGKLPPASEEVSKVLAKVCGGDPEELLYDAYLDKAPDFIKNYLSKINNYLRNSTKPILLSQFPEEMKTIVDQKFNEIPDYQFVKLIINNPIDVPTFNDGTLWFKDTEQKDVKMVVHPQLGIPIDDDSMEPLIPKGSAVHMDNEGEISDNDLVIVLQEDTYLIRRLIKMSPTSMLIPLNKSYPNIPLSEDMKIIGKIGSVTIKV